MLITTKANKSLGEQHFIGVRKRDEALREKEEKAIELVKNSIVGDDDNKAHLYDNFGEFVKMDVNIIDEEITYEEIDDYQGSTYPENNMIHKVQSTPSQGNRESEIISDNDSSSKDNNENLPPPEDKWYIL